MTIRTTHTYEYQYSLLFGDAGYLWLLLHLFSISKNQYYLQLETFPSNIIAGMFGFKAADFLQTPEEEKSVPKVDFSGLGD